MGFFYSQSLHKVCLHVLLHVRNMGSILKSSFCYYCAIGQLSQPSGYRVALPSDMCGASIIEPWKEFNEQI